MTLAKYFCTSILQCVWIFLVPLNAQGGGTSFLATDGTVRVIPSSNGVPFSLRPGITAQSPLVIDSQSAVVNVSTAGSTISAYLSEYKPFLDSG